MSQPKCDDPLHHVFEFTDTFIKALRHVITEEKNSAPKTAAENDENECELDSDSNAAGADTPEASDSNSAPDMMPLSSTGPKSSEAVRTDIKTDTHGDSTKVTIKVDITSSAPSKCSHCCSGCSQQPERVLSRSELAIARLQEDYNSSWPYNSTDRMVTSVEVLTDDSMAGAFLALQPGNVRDRWLQRQDMKHRGSAF